VFAIERGNGLCLSFRMGSGIAPVGATLGDFENRAVTFFGGYRFPPHVRSEDCRACSDQMVLRRGVDAEDFRNLSGITTITEKEPPQKAEARSDAH
jgi:hypothetical protein